MKRERAGRQKKKKEISNEEKGTEARKRPDRR